MEGVRIIDADSYIEEPVDVGPPRFGRTLFRHIADARIQRSLRARHGYRAGTCRSLGKGEEKNSQ
jgi:hypothetical protein